MTKFEKFKLVNELMRADVNSDIKPGKFKVISPNHTTPTWIRWSLNSVILFSFTVLVIYELSLK